MDWQETFSGKTFISDLGEEQKVENGGEEMLLDRYAVWAPVGGKNHRIVEISGDLPALMEKYNISQDRVCVLVQ